MDMYLAVCVRVYTCTYVLMYACMCVCVGMYIRKLACVFVHIQMYLYVCIYVCMYVCKYVYSIWMNGRTDGDSNLQVCVKFVCHIGQQSSYQLLRAQKCYSRSYLHPLNLATLLKVERED